MNELRDLELLINSSVPIIVVETNEEKRVVDLLQKLAISRLHKPP